jgi:hypothetical protein
MLDRNVVLARLAASALRAGDAVLFGPLAVGDLEDHAADGRNVAVHVAHREFGAQEMALITA